MAGFKVVDSMEYGKFELEDGVKPFKDIPTNKYYINGIPAAYLVHAKLGNHHKL